ncbi:Permeases of the major facilitator superfamily (plasmid) [Bacillus thuringiensis MC28]|nr:Permeases of the major facilitator superfamily [Bacillus thuringiensis MC28]
MISYMINVLIMALACWVFIELYYGIMELANIIEAKKVSFEVSLNITPVLFLLVIGIVMTVFYKMQKKKYKALSYLMYPLLFPLEDEREKLITERACRTAFVSLWYVLIFAVGFLVLSPIFNIFIPGYPLYIVFSVFFIQMTVFYISLYRNKII